MHRLNSTAGARAGWIITTDDTHVHFMIKSLQAFNCGLGMLHGTVTCTTSCSPNVFAYACLNAMYLYISALDTRYILE